MITYNNPKTINIYVVKYTSNVNGRNGVIRTHDPLFPKQMRYQTAPRSDWWLMMESNHRPPPYQDGALTN